MYTSHDNKNITYLLYNTFIMTSQGLQYDVVVMTFVLQVYVILHWQYKYDNKYIFFSYVLA